MNTSASAGYSAFIIPIRRALASGDDRGIRRWPVGDHQELRRRLFNQGRLSWRPLSASRFNLRLLESFLEYVEPLLPVTRHMLIGGSFAESIWLEFSNDGSSAANCSVP